MTTPQRTSVLIVGAGPTGLMLANQLARRGVRPVIIDRNPGPSIQSKALGVQARTLEFYHHMGLAQPAIERGMIANAATMWAGGRRTATVPLGAIGAGLSPYPYLLILGQDANERLLGDRLAAHGIEIRWRTELTAIEQSETAVTATVRAPDGSLERLHADWLAGCDGSRSTVRTLRAIDFPGAPYEHVFFVSDVTLTGSMDAARVNIYLWKGGFYLFFPMRGENHWRVVGILPKSLRNIEGLTFDPVGEAVRCEAGADLRFDECRWFGTYRVHHRCAERFRDGRCFLLGDAAHIHSPVGAQGMNTGLQDACNLAWKLALVVHGRAAPALLETYAPEREPFARRLLATTDRAFAAIVAQGPGTALFRTRLLPSAFALAMRVPATRRLAFRTISQIGIRYPRSPLSQASDPMPRGSPRPGDRFPWLNLSFDDPTPPIRSRSASDGPLPIGSRSASDGPTHTQGIQNPAHLHDLFQRLDDTRFNLLLFAQPAPALTAAFTDLVRTLAVTESDASRVAMRSARIPSPSFYLLRPDGHVGLSGRRADANAIERYLRERVGILDVLPA